MALEDTILRLGYAAPLPLISGSRAFAAAYAPYLWFNLVDLFKLIIKL